MSALETPESPVTRVEPEAAPEAASRGGTTAGPGWRESVTGQWESMRRGLRAGAKVVRHHHPEHATSDPHAERVAAAGMGLLVLIGAVITYVAVVGGIDPLLRPPPAGGAPPAVVHSVSPTTPPPVVPPQASGPEEVAGPPEPTPSRPRLRASSPPPTTRPPTTTPTPSPTPTPTPTNPTPSPSPRPSG
jgi:hypothetical protein